jgi:hypothetical protein
MRGRKQRLGDLLSEGGSHRIARHRLCAVIAVGLATALAGCGSRDSLADDVARPVAPPPLPEPTVTARPAATAPGLRERDHARAARSPATRRRILSSNDRAGFRRLAASLGGEHGLAVSGVGPGRRVELAGSLRTGVAWSTSKVPVAMAVIAAGGRQAQQQDLTQALTASDNAAALRLWATLGSDRAAARAANEQLRQAGDQHTEVEYRRLRGPDYTPFGQTRWALSDQARFTAGLACLSAGAEVLGLMNQVVPDQRWGLGAAAVDVQFKGGWGPGSEPGVNGSYLDRQMGVITIAGKPLAVAIATRPADGSHETGTANLTTIARWLVAHANVRAVPRRPRC